MGLALEVETDDEALLDKASKLSGLHDRHQVIVKALEDFVQKMELDHGREELRRLIDVGIADEEAGRMISAEEFWKNARCAAGLEIK
jgi:predicted transcriptional regulator